MVVSLACLAASVPVVASRYSRQGLDRAGLRRLPSVGGCARGVVARSAAVVEMWCSSQIIGEKNTWTLSGYYCFTTFILKTGSDNRLLIYLGATEAGVRPGGRLVMVREARLNTDR